MSLLALTPRECRATESGWDEHSWGETVGPVSIRRAQLPWPQSEGDFTALFCKGGSQLPLWLGPLPLHCSNTQSRAGGQRSLDAACGDRPCAPQDHRPTATAGISWLQPLHKDCSFPADTSSNASRTFPFQGYSPSFHTLLLCSAVDIWPKHSPSGVVVGLCFPGHSCECRQEQALGTFLPDLACRKAFYNERGSPL